MREPDFKHGDTEYYRGLYWEEGHRAWTDEDERAILRVLSLLKPSMRREYLAMIRELEDEHPHWTGRAWAARGFLMNYWPAFWRRLDEMLDQQILIETPQHFDWQLDWSVFATLVDRLEYQGPLRELTEQIWMMGWPMRNADDLRKYGRRITGDPHQWHRVVQIWPNL